VLLTLVRTGMHYFLSTLEIRTSLPTFVQKTQPTVVSKMDAAKYALAGQTL
jgi:hypothetical protein